ncbi:hypothetical protein CNR22_04200 [Sphingobacteriaceae bacterium]|nr:hypothetical protein CNR22_04200 [Sphingobacteriaceae bacterium]
MKHSVSYFFLLAFSVFVTALHAQVPSICYAPAANYTTGSTGYGVTSGDFNEDGHPDLAVVNFLGSSMSIRMGSATGALGAPVIYTITAFPWYIINTDINSDGHVDLIISHNSGSQGISVLIGNGAGAFTSVPGPTLYGPLSIVAADFNNDGLMDIATPSSVLPGNGNGTFGTAFTFTTGTGPHGVTAGDFNNDGNMDLAVANDQTNDVSVVLGNGTGAMGPASSYVSATNPYDVTTADYNNDGKLDLAVCNFSDNYICVFIGLGNGTFNPRVNYIVNTQIYKIISKDFNNDGKMDIATATYSTSSASILLGNGTGTFSTVKNIPTAQGPNSIISADFNSDGLPDIATANSFSNGATVLLAQALPSITVNSGSVCSGKSFTLSASGGTAYGYPASNPVVNPTGPVNSYTVSGIGANGCTNTAVSSITVIPSPVISASDATICIGDNYTITATGAATYSYAGGSAVVSPSVATSYTVAGTSSLGCISSNVENVVISVNPTPTLVAGATAPICNGDAVTLTVSGAVTYSWSSGAQGPAAVVTPSATTDFTVTGYNTEGCATHLAISQVVNACTGISSLMYNSETITSYPNPASSNLVIKTNVAFTNATIELYNLLGEKVAVNPEVSETTVLDLSKFEKGIYTLRIVQNKELIFTKKVVKD